MTAVRDPEEKTVVVFDHIPKCAGSSIGKILEKSECTSYSITSAWHLVQTAKRMNAIEHAGLTFIFGHYTYGVHSLLSPEYTVRYFTFLRDPVDIALSLYYYNKTRHEYQYGSVYDFLAEYPFDHMVNFLGGSLGNAMQRLEKYIHIGFVDTLEGSIRELGNMLNVSLDPESYVNKSKRDADSLRIPRDDLRHHDAPDIKLYARFRNAGACPDRVDEGKKDGECCRTDSSAVTLLYSNNVGMTSRNVRSMESLSYHQAVLFSKKLQLGINDEAFARFVARFKDITFDAIDFGQVTDASRYALIESVLRELLEHVPGSDPFSQVTLQAQQLLLHLARTPYAESAGLAEGMARRALQLNPENCTAVYQFAVWLRMHGRPLESLEVLETIPQESRALDRFYPEYIATLCVAKGRQAVLEFLAGDRTAEDRHRASVNSLRSVASPSRTGLGVLQGKKVLAVRSGPEIVLLDLLESLKGRAGSLTLLLQRAMRDNPQYAEHARLFVPDGMFKPDLGFEDRADLLAGDYACIVCVCSNFGSLNSLTNYVSFFHEHTRGSVFAYPLANLSLAEDEKYLIALGDKLQRTV